MDLKKVPDNQKLKLCRQYFFIGFGFLPFLWLVNTLWFLRDAFFRDNFEEQKELKKYVIRSGIGTIIWIIGIITWVTVYQLNRANWGALGDSISFLIPLGKA